MGRPHIRLSRRWGNALVLLDGGVGLRGDLLACCLDDWTSIWD